jgi:hypothetical protein
MTHIARKMYLSFGHWGLLLVLDMSNIRTLKVKLLNHHFWFIMLVMLNLIHLLLGGGLPFISAFVSNTL